MDKSIWGVKRRLSGQSERQGHGKRGPRGDNGAKNLNGLKRNLLVDTGGMVLKAVIQSANLADRYGAHELLESVPREYPMVQRICADMGYRGPLLSWAQQRLGVAVDKRPSRWVRVPADEEPPSLPSITILPRRWVFERTYAWLGRYRRLRKDYEQLPTTEEAWIYAAMTQFMIRRLAPLPLVRRPLAAG